MIHPKSAFGKADHRVYSSRLELASCVDLDALHDRCVAYRASAQFKHEC
jgi:hypothetical protein